MLAVTKSASTGLGMGMAVIFVLVLSNMIISLVRNIIPKKVRIACFIVISASLVVAVELLMQAYAYPLYQSLGIFVPLIVVNCIILGRAEAFAGKNPVLPSIADGLGMGLGYTVSLTFLGGIRELFGAARCSARRSCRPDSSRSPLWSRLPGPLSASVSFWRP